MDKLNAKPFVKWAGGKRQLLDQFEKLYPKRLLENKIDKYIEPFTGGGAVFFELASKYDFKEIILNDINKELILTYTIIRDNVHRLISELAKLQETFLNSEPDKREEMYYQIRDRFNTNKLNFNYDTNSEEAIHHSSYFLFLNKTCFNGLYRENKSGLFNVPFGKYKNPTIVDSDNLIRVSNILKNVKLTNVDFEELTPFVNNNTFVYIDPPYRPLNITSSFSSYSKGNFNDDDQIRLAKWYKTLSANGAYLMLSNSNPKNTNKEDNFFEKLYGEFVIREVSASRSINSKGNKRGTISELAITSYKEEI